MFDIISEPSFLASVESKGKRLVEGLRSALAGNPHIKEVRGVGLIVGIQLDQVGGCQGYPSQLALTAGGLTVRGLAVASACTRRERPGVSRRLGKLAVQWLCLRMCQPAGGLGLGGTACACKPPDVNASRLFHCLIHVRCCFRWRAAW